MTMTLSPFDCYFNSRDEFDTNLLMAMSSDSPFDDGGGLPFVYSPFSYDSNLGSKNDDGINEFGTSTRPIPGVLPPSPSPRSVGTMSVSSGGNNIMINNQTTQPPISIVNSGGTTTTTTTMNNGSPNMLTTQTNNSNNVGSEQPGMSTSPSQSILNDKKKKKKTIIKLKTKKSVVSKKSIKGKKNKGPAYPGARYEDVFTNNDLQADFLKYLKKKANENDLKFVLGLKRFEEETQDIHSKAMNICFEFLGVGGGGLLVSVEGSVVSELSQIIRNRQSTKEMFNRAKQIVEGILRTNFTEYNS